MSLDARRVGIAASEDSDRDRTSVWLEMLPEFDPMTFGVAKPSELAFTLGVRPDRDRKGLDAILVQRGDDGFYVVAR